MKRFICDGLIINYLSKNRPQPSLLGGLDTETVFSSVSAQYCLGNVLCITVDKMIYFIGIYSYFMIKTFKSHKIPYRNHLFCNQ